jgi:hypothetical protein
MEDFHMRPFLLPIAVALAGCSGGGGGDDAAAPPDLSAPLDFSAPDDMAFAPQLPLLVNHGGPVLASVELWTVVFQGDEALGADLDAFHRDMFATDYYWTGILGQYGVTGGTAKGVIVLPQAKPATLQHDAIPALLDGAAATLGAAKSASTALVLLLPSTTTLLGGNADLAGYHNATAQGLPMAVLTQVDTHHGTPFQNLTFIASHEVAELAVNPRPDTQPAWYRDDLYNEGEVADLCNPLDALIYAIGDGGMPDQGTYLVARLWNNQAASGGKVDPCWHYPMGVPWFDVAVDPLVARPGGAINLHVFSYGNVGAVDWQIEALPTGVKVTPSSGTNQVGDTIPIAIDPGSVTMSFPLVVLSTSEKTTYQSVWWFLVQP